MVEGEREKEEERIDEIYICIHLGVFGVFSGFRSFVDDSWKLENVIHLYLRCCPLQILLL